MAKGLVDSVEVMHAGARHMKDLEECERREEAEINGAHVRKDLWGARALELSRCHHELSHALADFKEIGQLVRRSKRIHRACDKLVWDLAIHGHLSPLCCAATLVWREVDWLVLPRHFPPMLVKVP